MCGYKVEIRDLSEMKVTSWTSEHVSNWLRENDFEDYIDKLRHHKIDGVALLALSEQNLRETPLALTIFGDIKRLALAIRKLRQANEPFSGLVDANGYISSARRTIKKSVSMCSETPYSKDDIAVYPPSLQRLTILQPEYTKLFLAFCYMGSVLLLNAYVMVVVHDRVPDMKKYPPLPDLMLDNIPYIEGAFQLSEVTAIVLGSALIVALVFHKHRFIILRRLCALTGTMILLRCFTMCITSLSVPATHHKCYAQPNATFVSQFERALVIWKGAGMSIQGVRTCGDYMFSGHTLVITGLNFFFTEYTPRSLFPLHLMSWLCNGFGLFFILAAHEHYSIDVFIAFYITSHLFLYYHSLANNWALRKQGGNRTRILIPLFSFFESKT